VWTHQPYKFPFSSLLLQLVLSVLLTPVDTCHSLPQALAGMVVEEGNCWIAAGNGDLAALLILFNA